MTVYYEWDVEIVDTSEGEEDIIEHLHKRSYKEAIEETANLLDDPALVYRVCLVRDNDQGRSWAYVKDGELPAYFMDSNGVDTDYKVPQKFHKEISRN